METRKVQVTGGSTYTVSIPKDWAAENGVDSGSVVELYPDADTLLLTPKADEETLEGTVDVTGLTGERLTRTVLTAYVAGFDVVVLEAGRITADQRRSIREAVGGLVGVELLEESDERVVIRDLLDSSQLSIGDAVDRMSLIARSMLDDAVTALVAGDDDLARDVVARDDDVDRLWLAVARIFRSTLRSPVAAEELGVTPEDCFDYHTAARQLERVADHASKIASAATEVEGLDDDVAGAVEELHAAAAGVIDGAVEALFADDPGRATRLANEARADVAAVDRHTREVDELLRDLEPAAARTLGLVVDSLSRSADYGGNVAESALQRAAPSPGGRTGGEVAADPPAE